MFSRPAHRVLFRSLLATLFYSVGVVGFLPAAESHVPANRQAIADVNAGRVDRAEASWWGFDPADSTTALQTALDSRAQTIVIKDMGTPWIVTTIQLPSDKRIIFESGTVIEAKRGEFRKRTDCLFVANGVKNLIVEGQGGTLRMHKADYHQPPYEKAEWRHALTIRGCEDVTVQGLTLKESGGDGVYLGVGNDGATNRNITLRKLNCDGNNRQGISVITAENLLIEDCVFQNTAGTAPQAGIDFEPNRPTERLVNCVLRNCRSDNNAGHAYHLYLGHLHRESPPVSIRFENCTSQGNQRHSTNISIRNREGKRSVRGSIAYVDCRFDADAKGGIHIQGNEADGCQISLQQCELIRNDSQPTPLAPITIEAPRRLDIATGNIQLDDVTIRDSLDRRPIGLVASPMNRLQKLSGSLNVISPAAEQRFTLDTAQLAEWFPTQGQVEQIPCTVFDWRNARLLSGDPAPTDTESAFRLRRRASLSAWGRANVPIRFTAALKPVGKHTPAIGTMTLTMPNEKTQSLKPKRRDNQLDFTFTPTTTGPCHLLWEGDSNATIDIAHSTTPLSLLCESSGIDLMKPQGQLYFVIPSGVQRFAIQITGAGTGETVKASVHNATGRAIETQDNIALPHVFILERKQTETSDGWSLELGPASNGHFEDVAVQVLGIPPILATTRAGVLICEPADTPQNAF